MTAVTAYLVLGAAPPAPLVIRVAPAPAGSLLLEALRPVKIIIIIIKITIIIKIIIITCRAS